MSSILFNQKYYLPIVGLFLSLFILSSCGGAKSNAPLKERNAEVRVYFDALDTLVDEYCSMVENLAEGAMEIEDKEARGEETSFMDGLNLLTDMATSATKIARLAEKIEKMKERHPDFEENLSADDFEEFMKLFTSTMKRFYELGEKMEAHD